MKLKMNKYRKETLNKNAIENINIIKISMVLSTSLYLKTQDLFFFIFPCFFLRFKKKKNECPIFRNSKVTIIKPVNT